MKLHKHKEFFMMKSLKDSMQNEKNIVARLKQFKQGKLGNSTLRHYDNTEVGN